MRLARVSPSSGEIVVVAVNDDDVQKLDLSQVEKCHKLSDILHSPDPVGLAKFLIDPNATPLPIDEVRFMAPIDQQEVWAAGSNLQAKPGSSNGRIGSRRVALRHGLHR